jgi:hypothetical protein
MSIEAQIRAWEGTPTTPKALFSGSKARLGANK